jgi:fatty acid desaturase
MLSREDNRRLAQLERQLRRDDPEFCARMSLGGRSRRRLPLALVFVAVLVWSAALVFGVTGWWIAAAVCAVCATALVVVIACRYRPGIHGYDVPRRW